MIPRVMEKESSGKGAVEQAWRVASSEWSREGCFQGRNGRDRLDGVFNQNEKDFKVLS